MKKYIGTAAAVVALAIPAAASAAAPDGEFNRKDNGKAPNENACTIGTQSAAITQNGQFVSGQENNYGIDQTTTPGSRAALASVCRQNG